MPEGTYIKPTVTIGESTKKSDYDNLVGFIAEGEILDGDAGYTLLTSDSGKTARVNSGGAQTVDLPSVDATNIGAMFGVWKLGAGNVTIQAADADTINDGAAGGTLINSTATQTWGIVILQLVSETKWIVRFGVGTWATSNNTFTFGVAAGSDFSDGGEVGGAKRTLGNTDANIMAFITSNNDAIVISALGEVTKPLQPAFLATASQADNVTGNSALYTIIFDNEVFDQNGDFDGTSTFTAPVTGKYYIGVSVGLQGLAADSVERMFCQIVASNRTMEGNEVSLEAVKSSSNYVILHWAVLIDMDAADTVVCKILCSGAASNMVDIRNATYMHGHLVC